MKIEINDKRRIVPKGTLLGEVIDEKDYVEGCVVGIIEKAEKTGEGKEGFEIYALKGKMEITLNKSKFAGFWKSALNKVRGKKIILNSSKVLGIGLFPSEIEVDKGLYSYKKWDVFFGNGGFDNKSTYVMIAKKDHKGTYGVKGGVFGKLMRGRYVVDSLEKGDSIDKIRILKREEERMKVFSTTNMNLRLKDGMSIYTFVHILLSKEAPIACEHFLSSTKNNELTIDESTSAYVSLKKLAYLDLRQENACKREKYSITVRNQGKGKGRIYFYRANRSLHPSHSCVGKITQGEKIIDGAKVGDHITVHTTPRRLFSAGMTQSEAENFFRSYGIEHFRKGNKGDNGLIVSQKPELTMELLKEKRVESFGVDSDTIMDIILYEKEAPATVNYIRKVSGLAHGSVGQLTVYFSHPQMTQTFLRGNKSFAENLLPENPPTNVSKKGELGVTNMSKVNIGMIGIRLKDSPEFGSTGEEFYATNMAGKVIKNLDMLKSLKPDDILYVREVKK